MNLTLLDQNSPRLDVHSKIQLFPHQQALVHKMIDMEGQPRDDTFIAVLKDPPGYGKSYPLLALMLHEKRLFGKTQNLLVIPHNIHEQWLKYISDFSDELQAKSLMYYGDITALNYDARALFEYDILITTSTFYSMLTDTVRDIGAWFNRVVLDEIDSISFFTSVKIPSQSVWLVSASAELTTRGVYKESAQQNVLMCDPLFVKRSINLIPPLLEHHTCENEHVKVLQKGGVIEDMKAVYALDFSMFKFAYLRNESITNAKELLSAVFRDHCMNLASTIESIITLETGAKFQSYLVDSLQKKIRKKERLIAAIDNIVLVSNGKCPMCCDKLCEKKEIFSTRCCDTRLCKDCIHNWLSQSENCPKCYELLKKDDLYIIHAMGNDVNNKDLEILMVTDKLEKFTSILEKEIKRENFRILIFSDHVGTFLKIHDILKNFNLKHAEIEGNQITMTRAINDYKNGKKPVMLVDSLAYGAGMNLHTTTAVILLHKTERESQVIGRAQRLGRTDQLHIHHIQYQNE